MSNPFEAINNMYNESVKEADKAGFADTFKKATEEFFNNINFECEDLHFDKFTFYNIDYLDGYFIFGSGTNSVVHFYIKECPGWKFGIWWDTYKEEDEIKIVGDFFAQYERTIDKFKPSASAISYKIYVNSDCSYISGIYDIVKKLKFIKEEPYLAFCNDYMFWDYDTEYHSRFEAHLEYIKYRYRHSVDKYFTNKFNNDVIKFVNKNIVPLFNQGKLNDNGENWSPRYEVIAPFNYNTDLVDEPGYYDWFEKDDIKGQKIIKRFKKLIHNRQIFMKIIKLYFFNPCAMDVYFYDLNSDNNTDKD